MARNKDGSRLERILDVLEDPCWKTLKSNIDMPMLVVIGAQSSGKSSVLSSIACMPFPVSDDICTKFVTKLVCRCQTDTSVRITITPSPDRKAKDQERLGKFKPPTLEPKELDKIIEAVGRRVGADYDDSFCQDVLEVHIASPEVPSVTLVDLPGLIDVAMSETQSEDDIAFVREKVAEYVKNPRCLVLAVVDGSKDLSSNQILRYLTDGEQAKRTIGILTKPDLIPRERVLGRYIDLISNNNHLYRAGLGWYVVRNRAPGEQHFTDRERDNAEMRILSQQEFNSIPTHQKGAQNLRSGILQKLLPFYEGELMPLRQDILKRLEDTDDRLKKPPSAVSDPTTRRTQLFAMLNKIHSKAKASFPSPFSTMGLAPYRAVSWVTTPPDGQQKLQALDVDLVEKLRYTGYVSEAPRAEAATFAPAAVRAPALAAERPADLRQQAGEFVARYPVAFGTIPWDAARALLLGHTRAWGGVFHAHIDGVCDTFGSHLREIVQVCVDRHLYPGVAELVVTPVVGALRSVLQSRLPSWWSPGSSTDLTSAAFSPDVTDSVLDNARTLWREELDRSFVDATIVTYRVGMDENGRLPRVDAATHGALDLQALRQSLLSCLKEDRFATAAATMAVTMQCQVWRLARRFD